MVLAMLLIAAPALCAGPEGILRESAGTTVDGTMALDGMRVFGGQMLRTPRGRFSELLVRGGSLRLLSDTKLKFDGDSADLLEGGVVLNMATRFPVRSQCAEITPASAESRYTVQLLGKTVYVTADENEVTVRALKSVRVRPGKMVAVYCGARAQDVLFVGSNFPSKAAMGAVAGAVAVPFILPNLSAESPRR